MEFVADADRSFDGVCLVELALVWIERASLAPDIAAVDDDDD
jgi:hypothetical protein